MKKRILIIDDDQLLTEGLQIILASENYEVQVMSEGKVSLQKVSEFKPHTILIDYTLPGENGVQISQRIRTKYSSKALPIIMMSANLSNLAVAKRYTGIQVFLAKPFDISDLLREISLNS